MPRILLISRFLYEPARINTVDSSYFHDQMSISATVLLRHVVIK